MTLPKTLPVNSIGSSRLNTCELPTVNTLVLYSALEAIVFVCGIGGADNVIANVPFSFTLAILPMYTYIFPLLVGVLI